MSKISNAIKKNKSRIIMYIFIVISIILCTVGITIKTYSVSIIGIMIIFLYSLYYSLINIKQRFPLCIMLLMIFTFILSRPLIDTFSGKALWNKEPSSLNLALLSIILSIVFILLGFINKKNIMFRIKKIRNAGKRNKRFKNRIFKSERLKRVQKKYDSLLNNKFFCNFLFYGMIITFLINFSINILQYIDLHDVDYALLYSTNKRNIPKVFSFLSETYAYMMCFYLATLPCKRKTIITLALYLISGVPMFLIGNRGALVLKITFILVYIFVRYREKIKKYLNFKTLTACIILAFIGIMGLGAYNYIRSDEEIPDFSPVQLVTDFFYKQGTTFTTICQGFEYREKLIEQKKESYTFGNIIDYLKYSTISKTLFHTEDLGSGNTVKRAKESNNLAHRLSYIVLGKTSYLAGHGRGTSYIIETYMDFGIIGVILFSFIIGMYLKTISEFMRYKWISKSIILITLTKFFLIPRSESIEFIEFIIKPQFLIIIFIILIWYIADKKKNNVQQKR